MVSVISLIGVFLASLTSRILVSRKVTPGFDIYGHLCFASTLREQRRGPFGSITLRLVGASAYSQPFMWHWLVGFFDAKWLQRNQAWLNAVIYEMATRRMLFRDFVVEIEGDTLSAKLIGESLDQMRHSPAVEPKGATMTDLSVTRTVGGEWVAQCIVDV